MEASSHIHQPSHPHLRWQILGPMGMFVQAFLGVLSLSALLIKRRFEKPQRSWKVWLLDNSKQAFGALLQHSLNMFLAILLSQSNQSDNWDWYFINFAADVCIGVPLCYVGLQVVEYIGLRYDIEELNTGVYVDREIYTPDLDHLDPTYLSNKAIDYRIWIIQLAWWGLIVSIVKAFLFFVLQFFSTPLELTAGFLLGWLDMYPNVKLILIMMIIPLILNWIQFWVQDNILKAKKETNDRFMSLSLIRKSKSVCYHPRGRNENFNSMKSTQLSKKSNSFCTNKEMQDMALNI